MTSRIRRRLAGWLLEVAEALDVAAAPDDPEPDTVADLVGSDGGGIVASLCPRAMATVAFGIPRCAGCGKKVDTSIFASDGADGRETADAIEVACDNAACLRFVDTVVFEGVVSVADAALVVRGRPVVLGEVS